LFIEVPDLPPADRFPQAHATARSEDRALVMMAGVTGNGRWPAGKRLNCNTRSDFAVDGLQFPRSPLISPDMLKSCCAAELFDGKVFEMQRNLMLLAARFDAIGSDF
jgi:hypothetical protein